MLRRMSARLAGAMAAVLLLTAAAGSARAEGAGRRLVPVGEAVGIAVDIDGAVVIDVVEIQGKNGKCAPARDAGIHRGDVITQIGASPVTDAQSVRQAVENAGGKPVTVRVDRGGELKQFSVTPCETDDGGWELGVWLRDSLFGLGTVTFVSPETGEFCALGHAITDVDTGILIPLESGRILKAQVTGIVRGKPGTPGQLQGTFAEDGVLGDIRENTRFGIFGETEERFGGRAADTETDMSGIKTGEAVILSDAAGGEPEAYTVEITRIYNGEMYGGKELMLTVTDQRLLELTGGIVQGMSGSPILQNGKLVGAVTHVLVNDPTRGYGISAGSILRAMEKSEQQKAS